MTLSIGVAIPCYKAHIPLLKYCLDSIEDQTYKPTSVVVSCSSTQQNDPELMSYMTMYSFPLTILVVEGYMNCAQNRNRATDDLSHVDLITFIDADDMMHPQRLEIIAKVFTDYPEAKALLHNYTGSIPRSDPWPMFELDKIIVEQSKIFYKDNGINSDHHDGKAIHNAHTTIRRGIGIRFREEHYFIRWEDSKFTRDLVENFPGSEILYCDLPLTRFYPSCSC